VLTEKIWFVPPIPATVTLWIFGLLDGSSEEIVEINMDAKDYISLLPELISSFDRFTINSKILSAIGQKSSFRTEANFGIIDKNDFL
jgi:hypothetical protein